MTRSPITLRRRLRPALLLAALVVAAVGVGPGPTSAAVTYETTTPMVLQSLTLTDVKANTHGICNGAFSHAMKNAAGPNNAVNFLDAAQRCGLKVIMFFPETVDEARGVVYPSNVAYWVGLVKKHPALWGYLSVKEPSLVGVSESEIRALYRAFKAADPNHPVMALFGDIPHFGDAVNPYTAGMADVVMVDWYPVETTNGTDSIYLTSGPKWFDKVRGVVAAKTPGRPIWLLAQTHRYTTLSTHKKQRPTESQLRRQVRDGFTYLRAQGIAFHTWTNTNYQSDQLRDPEMVRWMKRLSADVRAGVFN